MNSTLWMFLSEIVTDKDFSGNSTQQESTHCKDAFTESHLVAFFIVLYVYSIVVLILYCVIQKRSKLSPDCCYGHCGLPIPINLISETKDRWVYCAAFGMLANWFFQLTIGTGYSSTASSFSDAVYSASKLLFTMLSLPLNFFALIASIHGPLQPLSHLIGLIYSAVFFTTYMKPCAICIHYAHEEPRGIEFLETDTASWIVSCVPLLICNGIVLVYFVVRGVHALVLRLQKKPPPKQHSIDHYIGYVKNLVNNPQTDLRQSNQTAKQWLYTWDPYFKYSVLLLSVFVVIFVSLLVFSVQTAFLSLSAVYELKEFLIIDVEIKWTDVLETIYKVLSVLVFAIPLISFVMVVIPLVFSLATFRRHCKQLWHGDRSFIPGSRKSPTRLLTNAALLFGRQIAMAVWAWIFYAIILFILLTMLAMLIIGMVFSDTISNYVAHTITFILCTFGSGVLIYYCQVLLVYFVFADKSVLVDNRRLFHLYTFFFLFYNTVSGLMTTIRRIITSFLLTLFLLPRLDRPLVIAGWEWLDKGYASYLSYVQVEASYTNPVMNVFVHLVMAQIEGKSSSSSQSSSHPGVTNSSAAGGTAPLLAADELIDVNDMARRRWYLAYTLLRNPQLIELRRGPTTEYLSAGGSSVNNKNVDLKLTSGISLTEDYQV
ncbi:stimulated by retinoic acid gene 6 protein-like [Dysidea avara]|uniref:stimulated by retinoic acid gene 6 protein-like n=1 Tax=Dysidea avara TaxID=196820 RepID=UPI00331C117D